METPQPTPAAPADAARCANCGLALLGEYCYACGQPVKGLVRHFSSVVGDVLDSLFSWDSRTPRTLWPLLVRPGFLTREYFDGRRIRYVSPVRLFFFIAVLTFFVGRLTLNFGLDGTVQLGGDSGIETARNIVEVEQARDLALARLESARGDVAGQGGNVGRAADAALRATKEALNAQARERIEAFRQSERSGGPPPVPRLHRLQFGQEPWDPQANPVRIDSLPGFANDWINRQVARVQRNVSRLREDPELFKDAVLGAVPSTLAVLLPLFALMLKLAYLFRRRLYMEHLMVALHSHAFMCLALLLLFVVMGVKDLAAPAGAAARLGFSLAEAAIWIWMPLYLLLMQKRVYAQGWPMTVLKFGVIGVLYSILLGFGAAFTTIASLVWM
jgi:hypothetical protein